MINILLADNQAIFRAGTVRVLAAQDDMRVVAQCEHEDDVLPMLEAHRGSILMVTAAVVQDMNRLLTVASTHNIRLILLTDGAEEPPGPLVRRIHGLMSRHATADDLLRCMRRVANGERSVQVPGESPEDAAGRRIRDSLTARELQIIAYVVQGRKNRQIAEEMGTKEQVVKNYLRSIYDKTGASDRLELALFTLHHRILAEAAARTIEPAAAGPR